MMSHPANSNNPPESSARQTYFHFFWAVAILFNTLPNFERDWGGGLFVLNVLSITAAIWLLLRPAALWRFLTAIAIYSVALYAALPLVNNHKLLILIIHLTVGEALLRPFWRGRAAAKSATAGLLCRYAPAVRWELLCLYFWATFHKLNGGFLDPDWSCGVAELIRLHEQRIFSIPLAFVPTGVWMQYTAIYATLGVELAIPLLLYFRRTRFAGVVLAGLFHFVLGLLYPTFSTVLYALFVLFLPESFFTAASDRWNRWRISLPGIVGACAARGERIRKSLEWLALLAGGGALVCAALLKEAPTPEITMRHSLFFVYGILVLALFVTIARGAVSRRGDPALFRPVGRCPLFAPVLVFCLGLLPYLGLNTTLAFAMFSNLRTEGGRTNHLLVPASWQIWDYQRDLVTIYSSSDPTLNRLAVRSWTGPRDEILSVMILPTERLRRQPPPTWQVPYVTVNRYVYSLRQRGHKNVRLVYERDGVIKELTNAERDPQLSAPPPLKKLMRLRAVPDVEQGCCMW